MTFKDYLGEFNKWLAERGYTEFEVDGEKGSSKMEGFEQKQGQDTWEKRAKKDGSRFVVHVDGSTNQKEFDQFMYEKYLAPKPQTPFDAIWGAAPAPEKPLDKPKVNKA